MGNLGLRVRGYIGLEAFGDLAVLTDSIVVTRIGSPSVKLGNHSGSALPKGAAKWRPTGIIYQLDSLNSKLPQP